MKKKNILGFVIVTAMWMFVSFFIPVSSQAFMDENCVRIGNVSPHTGGAGAYAYQAFGGMQIALDEINAKGGVLVQGKRVPLKIVPRHGYDSETKTGKAISLFYKSARQDKVLAIVQCMTSGTCDALYKEMGNMDVQVPIIANVSSAGESAKHTPWGFRWSNNETRALRDLCKLFHDKFNIRTGVIVLEKDSRYGNMVADLCYRPGCKEAGIKIVDTVTFLSTDKDFSSQAARLREAKAELIMLCSWPQSCYVIREAYRRGGVHPRVMSGCNGTNSPEFNRIAGKAAEGLIMECGYNINLPGAAKVNAKFKKRFKEDMDWFGASGYASMIGTAEAIEAAGIKNTRESLQEDRKKFRDTLASMKVFAWTGYKKFEPSGELWVPMVLIKIENGKPVIWDEKELPPLFK